MLLEHSSVYPTVFQDLELEDNTLETALFSKLGGRNKKRKLNDPDTEVDDTGHQAMSASAMSHAENIWHLEAASDTPTPRYGLEMGTAQMKELWKGLNAEPENANPHQRNSFTRTATMQPLRTPTEDNVRAWFRKLQTRLGPDGRPWANASQLEIVHKVCDRICTEIREESQGPNEATSQPLLWLLHGGPGTGKSHVIKLIHELFTEVMGWHMSVEFQTVALQAVMAEQLGGDTLHHAVGIPCFNQDLEDNWEQKQEQVAKRVMVWRWLIIDEISMVSAKLLAQTDVKLRDTIRRLHTHKLKDKTVHRAFGGLNVLFVGDFWQLPPPDGGNLSAVPVELMLQGRIDHVQPSISHGQYIFWGQGQHLSRHNLTCLL